MFKKAEMLLQKRDIRRKEAVYMPDWAEQTQELTGRAPEEAERSLWPRFLAGVGRGLLTLAGTVLVSLGLTVLVNPPLRENLWQWLRQLWGG